jgi:transposase
MKKMRRRYDREFKISVVAELVGGKPPAQIAREHGIHPSLPSRWRDELAENPRRRSLNLRGCSARLMQRTSF